MRNVVFSCDENGACFLRVAVWSLLEHYRGEEPICVNVFEGFGGHSAESKAALERIVSGFGKGHEVRYHDIESFVRPYADLILNREKSRWNVFTWTPIFTPQVLADATGTVIHFDIDMLFNADVSPLFELDFKDQLIACSYEYHQCSGKVESAIWEKGILPPEVKRYFNTGVLVFNTEKCREERTWEKIIEWYRGHYEIADRIEQDAWNALYHDRVLPLPIKWNFHDRNIKGYAKWNLDDWYWLGNSPMSCMEASLEPAILHFWGPKKPWKRSHRPYRKLYHAAMRAVGMTPPKEPLLAPYYDFVNWLNLRRIAWRRRREESAWERRKKWCAFKQALLAPFEWLGIGLGFITFAFLPHRAMQKLCDVVSFFYWALDFGGRAIARKNLKIILGEVSLSAANQRRIIRRSYRNMCRTIGHAFWTSIKAKERAAAVGEMDEKCRRFLAEHKPAITVSAHVGCWEILSQLAFLEGHSMMSVAKDIGTKGMTQMLMRSRRSIGQEIVSAEGAFKPLMQGLKDGKSLGLLVDQSVSPRKGGVWVRVLGVPIPVSAAPAFFSAKSKAPIIVAWSRPLKNGKYRCEYVNCYDSTVARDIWGLTQSVAKDIERVVRRHPSSWILNYDYFSRVPAKSELDTLSAREICYNTHSL